jgi:hypothetical protein
LPELTFDFLSSTAAGMSGGESAPSASNNSRGVESLRERAADDLHGDESKKKVGARK